MLDYFSVNSEGYPRIETKETNPVERALQYVFKERNASCVVGTEEILPLEFDHSVWSEYTDPAIR